MKMLSTTINLSTAWHGYTETPTHIIITDRTSLSECALCYMIGHQGIVDKL